MTKEKLKELLQDMSLEEKIFQMLQLTGNFYQGTGTVTGPEAEMGISQEAVEQAGSILSTVGAGALKKIQEEYLKHQPHKIPMLFMADIINGYKTIFPIPLAQGCSFDPDMAEMCAHVAGKEAGAAGLHVTFSPMVDLVRDARWGRVMESTGEDPYLNGCFAKAMVKGYQGENLSDEGNIAACVKHFAGYGAPVGAREYNNVELSERTLRDSYLPAYEEGIKAGAAMVMTSFNTLDHIPSTGNKKLMREILRERMGFDGVLISDWAAIEELIAHGMAEDHKEAAKLAVEAGVDIDMVTSSYACNLKELVEAGEVDESLIDEAVMRILELKNDLGLFENPWKDASEEKEKELLLCEEHRTLARKSAAETFVLLKNEGILPLKEKEQKIAVLGPYMNEKNLQGAWSLFADRDTCTSIREGFLRKAEEGKANRLLFARGCSLFKGNSVIPGFGSDICRLEDTVTEEERKRALDYAKEADIVILALGEHPLQSGEGASRTELTLPECQMELLKDVAAVNENVAVVLFQGRPLDLREIRKYARAVLVAWFPGTEGGNAIADVLYGDIAPSGKLAMSFPYNVGQVPVFYNEFFTGRPYGGEENMRFASKYLDAPNAPLYPFGYGLSYTAFQYGETELDREKLETDGKIRVKASLTNTGEREGTEVVQLYIRDVKGSVVRPVKELKGFRRVSLLPGETKEVEFIITEDMLRFTAADGQWKSEPGEFLAVIGGDSSADGWKSFWI